MEDGGRELWMAKQAGFLATMSGSLKQVCYLTPIKDLLWMAETSFHWLWQISTFIIDELNLAQDR